MSGIRLVDFASCLSADWAIRGSRDVVRNAVGRESSDLRQATPLTAATLTIIPLGVSGFVAKIRWIFVRKPLKVSLYVNERNNSCSPVNEKKTHGLE
jgi:hypothetical protein